jgi:hypothetical protein
MHLIALFPNEAIGAICGLFGYSRQAYYQGSAREEVREDFESRVLELVGTEREVQKRVGVLKLQAEWNETHQEEQIALPRATHSSTQGV